MVILGGVGWLTRASVVSAAHFERADDGKVAV
jgi:hypothetical protein